MEQTEWGNQEYNLWIKAGYPINDSIRKLQELRNVSNIPEQIRNLTNLQEVYIVNFPENYVTNGPTHGPFNGLPNLKSTSVLKMFQI